MDWDNLGRAETISIADATSGTVLDSRNISGFSNGAWLVWNLTGHVTMTVTLANNPNPNASAVVSGLFFDPAGPLTPDFLISATPSSQNVTRSSSANYTVAIAPEGGFVGTVALSASGLPSGATASFSPTSISGSSTATLMVSTNNAVAGGSYPITVTGVSGSLTHNTTVTLVVQVVVPASAVFDRYDTTNQGTWKGVYGSNGWAISNDSNNYPAYAQVALNGESSYTWASSTTDVRALQSGVTNGRIASTWYSSSSFSIDINLTDGNMHQVGLYALDWDNLGRAETISVTDATSGVVLDSRSISNFTNGEWLLWSLAGHVTMTVTKTGNANAVASGLFFDPVAALTPDFVFSATPSSQTIGHSASVNYTVTVSPEGGFAGTVALSASGLPSGVTASFNPTSITSSGTATLTLTTNSTAPGGTYPITVTGASGSITHSATVTLAVQASAVFVKFDTTNQGTWKGVYGSNGWAIANDSTNFPAYAQVAFNGESSYTWASSTSDVRALESGATGGRIAATWYASSSFTIDINLTDGNAHQVGLYALDWDNLGRAETISIADATSGTVLDSRSISGFTNGEWLLWNLTGHVTMTVTLIANSNPNASAVISGLFFDPAGTLTPDFLISATPSSQTVARSASVNYTVTISPEGGFVGTVALSASGLPSGATASISPTSISGASSATLMVSTNNAVPGGTYPITVTGVSGSLTHSTTVTLVVQVVVPASAVFDKYDTTNQGTWKGVYGSNGLAIANDSTNYPAYAQVALNGQSSYTWASSTTDVRALQSGVTNGRIASTWYSSSSFSIDINLTDGNMHQVGLYAVDWDNLGRAETISVTDATSGVVLDSRSISNFANGEWLLWNLAGHVTMTVTLTANSNPNASAVASGLFFDPHQ